MAKRYYIVIQRGLPMDVCSYRSSALERANQLSTKEAPAVVIEVEEPREQQESCPKFRTAEDYRDHLPCSACEGE